MKAFGSVLCALWVPGQRIFRVPRGLVHPFRCDGESFPQIKFQGPPVFFVNAEGEGRIPFFDKIQKLFEYNRTFVRFFYFLINFLNCSAE